MSFNFKSFKSEVAAYFKQVWTIKNSWIFLPGLISILLVYGVHNYNEDAWILTRGCLEPLAIWLVPIFLIVLVSKAIISKNHLMIYLAVLALIFLVRELDDTTYTFMEMSGTFKSKKPVNVILCGMALWGIGWHEKIFVTLNRYMSIKIALFGVLWTYFLSQLIARRAFRDVFPYESLVNVSLEEMTETAAHLFFIFFAFLSFYILPNKREDVASQNNQKVEI